MHQQENHPLTLALVRLISEAVHLNDTSTKVLAKSLRLAPPTIDHQWQEIFERLNVHSRGGAILAAFRAGINDEHFIFPVDNDRGGGTTNSLSADRNIKCLVNFDHRL